MTRVPSITDNLFSTTSKRSFIRNENERYQCHRENAQINHQRSNIHSQYKAIQILQSIYTRHGHRRRCSIEVISSNRFHAVNESSRDDSWLSLPCFAAPKKPGRVISQYLRNFRYLSDRQSVGANAVEFAYDQAGRSDTGERVRHTILLNPDHMRKSRKLSHMNHKSSPVSIQSYCSPCNAKYI